MQLKRPRHIAIIMDGNGRWAKRRHLPRMLGHQEGVKAVRKVIKLCGEIEALKRLPYLLLVVKIGSVLNKKSII